MFLEGGIGLHVLVKVSICLFHFCIPFLFSACFLSDFFFLYAESSITL